MSRARRRIDTAGAARLQVERLKPRRLLLDTHVWLWWQANDTRLGPGARELLAHAAEVHVSAVSAWEIAIKVAIGKLTLPEDADIEAEVAHCGFVSLSMDMAHAAQVQRLPSLHRDPFDRMLVAQARVEGLTLVTADPELAAYGGEVVAATA